MCVYNFHFYIFVIVCSLRGIIPWTWKWGNSCTSRWISLRGIFKVGGECFGSQNPHLIEKNLQFFRGFRENNSRNPPPFLNFLKSIQPPTSKNFQLRLWYRQGMITNWFYFYIIKEKINKQKIFLEHFHLINYVKVTSFKYCFRCLIDT
jgi:hypothetical protein